jgi:hypothetical protein
VLLVFYVYFWPILKLLVFKHSPVLSSKRSSSSASGSKARGGKSGGYFGPHTTKIQYLELSEQYSPEDPHGHKLLTTSLMKRAMTDIQRIWQLREEKPPLQQLIAKGAMGHELWDALLEAETELEKEVQQVFTQRATIEASEAS